MSLVWIASCCFRCLFLGFNRLVDDPSAPCPQLMKEGSGWGYGRELVITRTNISEFRLIIIGKVSKAASLKFYASGIFPRR